MYSRPTSTTTTTSLPASASTSNRVRVGPDHTSAVDEDTHSRWWWKPRIVLALPFVRAIATGIRVGEERYRLLRDAFYPHAVVVVKEEEWQSAKAVRHAAISAIAEVAEEAFDSSERGGKGEKERVSRGGEVMVGGKEEVVVRGDAGREGGEGGGRGEERGGVEEEEVEVDALHQAAIISSHMRRLEAELGQGSAEAEAEILTRLAHASVLSAEEWIGVQGLPPLYGEGEGEGEGSWLLLFILSHSSSPFSLFSPFSPIYDDSVDETGEVTRDR
uniref:Uncharacterized protein n=1 Tax=Palpitomonas bilix TaxID=652834 RepID=A0A7S3GD91_9EUKA|mmetsp:Transcript_4442/g.9073  ORF Transcript_4442/g.9073 Transcript_4442/m.9073 type:complete len:274 (+) Transcript_4442:1571-2392(+)